MNLFYYFKVSRKNIFFFTAFLDGVEVYKNIVFYIFDIPLDNVMFGK